MTQLPPNPKLGNGKAYAAAFAGAIVTAIVAIANQYLPHVLPAEAVAAFQTAATIIAVWYKSA